MEKSMRTIAALLLAAMLIPAAAACGEEAAGTPAADTTAAEETAEAVETDPTHDADGYLLDEIPDDLDYDGRTVNILKWDHYEIVDFNVEEENGEILNDALYNRNLAAEERLNIKLEFPQITARDQGETLIKTLQASIMSGLGAYDAAGINSTRNSNAAVAGLYIDLNTIDHLDFEKPWWSRKILDNASIAGKVFFATGDITVSSISRIMGVFVNKDLYAEFNTEDLFDIVLNGDWTLDLMLDMSKGVYEDLDGDGTKSAGDRYAYAADSFQLQAPFTGSNLKAVVQTDDGGLKVAEESYGERATLLLEKMIDFMQSGNDAYFVPKVDDRSIFNEGRVMFFSYVMSILASASVRDLEYDLAFIPWPKFDATEDEYVVPSSSTLATFGVPIDVQDPALCGAVLETLASESYRQVIPALFEVCYKVKYNNDVTNRQAEIFDLMRADRQYDIVRLFTYQVSFDPVGQFGAMIQNKNANWASTMASHLDANQKALDTLVEKISEFSN